MQLKDLNIMYINNPAGFSAEVNEKLESVFGAVFDVSTFEDVVNTFKDEFVDFLLIDIDYEEAGGIRFLNIIKQKIAEFPTIILTKQDIKEAKNKLTNISIDGIMHIPFEIAELLTKIHQIENKIIRVASGREDRKKEKTSNPLGVDESIDVYFKRFNDELKKTQKKKLVKTMDFSIMKTFLFTAYNNFNDFDSKFDDNNLKIAKANLEKAMKLRHDLNRRLSLAIEDNYETIFLLQQPEYKKIHHDYEEAVKKIHVLRNALGLITRELESQKEEIKRERKDSSEYEKLDKNIRELNGRHVDRVHEISELKNKITELEESIEAFKKKYFEEFKTAFTNKTEQIKNDITNSLNLAAYLFDKEIWRRAKQSRPVRQFFTESKIEGLFSSKTYLNYYISGLDKNNVSENNKKLVKYVHEFNKKNAINIAIIGNSLEDMNTQKIIIEKIDESLRVVGYLNYQKAIEQHEQFNFEYILIDDYIEKTSALEIINKFKQKYRDKFDDIEFCIIMPSKIKNDIYYEAKKNGITHFLNHKMTIHEFREKMLEIL